ncbi:MAG: aminodeoxychorismate synthase component I [Clostridium sp.]
MNIHIEELKTTLNPHEVYYKFKSESNTAFLDSGMDEKNLGRYSFIGLNRFLSFIWNKEGVYINEELQDEKDGFNCLNRILAENKIEYTGELPFVSGGIGYLSYDLCSKTEEIILYSSEDVKMPLVEFNFYNNIIIFDNLKKKAFISALEMGSEWRTSFEELKNSIYKYEREFKKEEIEEKLTIDDISIDYDKFISNFKEKEYVDTVDKVKEYIRSGDIYITNLTQRYKTNIQREDYEIYYRLRSINPAPFASFLKFNDYSIISSSPERFLEIRHGMARTRPIKGTRPRGSNIEENIRNKKALQNSEKDKSELLMIVDLERNDLSKLCEPHSIKVHELFKIEEYSTVYHLVSDISGKIKAKYNEIDCIRACFPGGSITGAPKIRSMEVIDELEGIKRNIYTGSIGYLSFHGNIDLNIIIRTILIKDNKAYFGVGGGITWESNSQEEYDESLQKAKALMAALS